MAYRSELEDYCSLGVLARVELTGRHLAKLSWGKEQSVLMHTKLPVSLD